ncbi:MAG: Lrp/AsnC family transcriptional regulator [Pseudomonadota bacterium]
MDDLDHKILTQLATDARSSIALLARRLDVARTTIQARIERLENQGVIAGYTIRLGEKATARRIRATALLQVEPRATPAVLQRLKALGQVETAHTTSGRFDLILGISVRSTVELDQTLDTIGAIQGVRSSESLIHLTTKIDRAL